MEILVDELLQQRVVGADDLVKKFGGKRRPFAGRLLQNQLGEHASGDVVAGLGIVDLHGAPLGNEAEDLLQREVLAARGVVVAAVGVSPQLHLLSVVGCRVG